MSEFSHDRIVTLANGESVPLGRAGAILGKLRSYQELQDTEWDVVYHLREVCLGRPLEREQQQTLIRERLLAADGSVDPVTRAVVLSAVRGHGRVLHLDSPFTDVIDQAMADYIDSIDALLSRLGPDQARAFFESDPVRRAGFYRESGLYSEISQTSDDPTPPPGLDEKLRETLRDLSDRRAQEGGWTDRVQPPDDPTRPPESPSRP